MKKQFVSVCLAMCLVAGLMTGCGKNAADATSDHQSSAETEDYSHMRTWIGHKELAPSEYGDYKIGDLYQLTFTPEKKVSL